MLHALAGGCRCITKQQIEFSRAGKESGDRFAHFADPKQ
jgi:hypothetical protein